MAGKFQKLMDYFGKKASDINRNNNPFSSEPPTYFDTPVYSGDTVDPHASERAGGTIFTEEVKAEIKRQDALRKLHGL